VEKMMLVNGVGDESRLPEGEIKGNLAPRIRAIDSWQAM
jgi:hypothetical protein